MGWAMVGGALTIILSTSQNPYQGSNQNVTNKTLHWWQTMQRTGSSSSGATSKILAMSRTTSCLLPWLPACMHCTTMFFTRPLTSTIRLIKAHSRHLPKCPHLSSFVLESLDSLISWTCVSSRQACRLLTLARSWAMVPSFLATSSLSPTALPAARVTSCSSSFVTHSPRTTGTKVEKHTMC